jgi:MscS family membrane protein
VIVPSIRRHSSAPWLTAFVPLLSLAWAAVAPARAADPAPARAATRPSAAPLANVGHPLAPLDTSSPRATLQSFRAAVDHIHAALEREGAAAQRRPETMRLIGQVLNCFDLSRLAPSLVRPEGIQAAVCIKEVLDRIPLPPASAIPDAAAVQAAGLKRWRLPGTEIVLFRIADGSREGDFVFDAETVSRAKQFYMAVRDLPYSPDAGSPGLHESYVEAGGWMIPEAVIMALPKWAHVVVGGETIWQWVATALLVGGAGVLALRAWKISRRLARRGSAGTPAGLVFPATLIALSMALDYLLSIQVRLTGDNLLTAKVGLRMTTLVGVVAGVLVSMGWLSDLLIKARGMRPEGIDSQLIRLGGKVLTFLTVSWIVIQAADSLGIPVTPLVAGLGAGGLAVALASQYTLENLIAGLVIFADRPVRIGDDCRFGDIRGRVEQIGLRSTRIRGDDRSLISVPNAEFAKLQLVNYTQRDHIPLKLSLSLSADTPPHRLRSLLARLRQVLADHPRLATQPIAARLVGQSDAGLAVEVSAVALTADDREFAAIREEVLLAAMEVTAAAEPAATLRAAA